MTVNPVNDAPVNTVPGAQTAQEDTPLLIAGLSVVDVDSPTLTVTLSADMEAWPLFRGSHCSPATCPILSRSPARWPR